MLTLCLLLGSAAGIAQTTMHRLPGRNKLRGSNRQAFSGVVQSLDTKLKILNVTTERGEDTEIFPIRKGTHVETLGGKKLKLKSLIPGTDVLIYYSENGGERSIQQVIVLEGTKGKKKQASRRRS